VKKLLPAFAGAVLVLSLTAGCQATPPDIAPDRTEAFQARILAVTSAVAEGGYAAALDALSALETELDAAAAAGSVSFARHQRIEAAMTVVRADVQAAIDAQAVPEPAPAPAPRKTAAPVEEEKATPDTETDAEKKAREAEEKAVEEANEKAEEEREKAAEKAAEDSKKAEEKAKKAEEDAKKKAEEDAEKTSEPSGDSGTPGRIGKGQIVDVED
jgi:outer membrane biosynthesis protein TonB